MDLDRRTRVALVLLGAVLAITLPVAADVYLSSYGTASTGRYGVSGGPIIELGATYEIQSGNPNTADSVNISTKNNGYANFTATGSASATVDQINGTWTNVSSVDATAANLTINPNDKHAMAAGGQVTDLHFKDVVVNDSTADLEYTATGQGTIIVRNATPGVQYGAIDVSNNQGLDAAVADSNGHVALTDLPSGTYTARVGELGSLEIRNESDPSQLVTNANATITFYFQSDDPLIVERSSQSGRIDMTGLPVDEDFVIVVSADGYTSRRIYVPNLLETQEVYLLPDTATDVDTIFELQDFSGRYPSDETAMQIQRALNVSGNVEWATVEGDYFGATSEFSTQLAQNQRHRLILENTDTGDTREIGTYTPLTASTKIIKVFANGSVSIIDEARVSVAPDLRALPAKSGLSIDVTTVSDEETLDHYNTTINLTYPNGTEVTLATLSGTQASGESLTASVDATNGSGGVVTVNTSLTLQDGSVIEDNTTYFVHEYFANQYNLLSILGDITNALPTNTVGMFTTFIALLVSVLGTAAAATRMPLGTEGLGLVFLGFVAAFVIIGWASAAMLFAGSVGWIGVAGLRRAL